MAQTDRDILFSNEAFVIGVLQAVSGGAIVAAISQSDALISLSGKVPFLLFITALAIALLSAVLAAYWKHQYKMWDVKAQASAAQQKEKEAEKRSSSANCYLAAMRSAFVVSVAGILLGVGELVVMSWVKLCTA